MDKEKAIKILRNKIECLSHSKCSDCPLDKVCDQLRTPSDSEYIAAYGMAIEALSAEPCEDAISRQAALVCIKSLYPDMPIVDIMDARRKWREKYAPYFECENAIESLPPVTPKQKMGRWIWKDGYHGIPHCKCSECGNGQWEMGWNYCPFCGAKMAESEDTE